MRSAKAWAAEIEQAVGYLVKLVQSLDPARAGVRASPCSGRRGSDGPAGAAGVFARRNILRLYVPGDWFYDGAFSIDRSLYFHRPGLCLTDLGFGSPLLEDFRAR